MARSSCYLLGSLFLVLSVATGAEIQIDKTKLQALKGHLLHFDGTKDASGHYLILGDKKVLVKFNDGLAQSIDALTKRPLVYWFEGEGQFKAESRPGPEITLANFSYLKEAEELVEDVPKQAAGVEKITHGEQCFRGYLLYFDGKDPAGHYLIVGDKKILVQFSGGLSQTIASMTEQCSVYRLEGKGLRPTDKLSEAIFTNVSYLKKAEVLLEFPTRSHSGLALPDF